MFFIDLIKELIGFMKKKLEIFDTFVKLAISMMIINKIT